MLFKELFTEFELQEGSGQRGLQGAGPSSVHNDSWKQKFPFFSGSPRAVVMQEKLKVSKEDPPPTRQRQLKRTLFKYGALRCLLSHAANVQGGFGFQRCVKGWAWGRGTQQETRKSFS